MDAPRYCYRHPDRETGLSCSECERPICYECMTPAPVGLRCPEHSGKPQGIRKATTPVQRAVTGVGSRRVNSVTMALIAINVGVFLAELAAGGNLATGTGNWIYERGSLFASGVYVPGGIGIVPAGVPTGGLNLVGVAHGEWWRMVTAAFLHYGPFHLAINMYSLYFAGTLLEQIIGRWRFALSPNSVTVGASGAIFGILGALFVLERRGNIATGGQIAALIVLNLIFTFAISNISVGGHIGGLIGGVILMWLLLQSRRSPIYSVLATGAVVLASVVIAYAKVRGYT